VGAGAGFIKPTGYCSYTRVVRVIIVLYNIYLQTSALAVSTTTTTTTTI
jgi:hypothetical protein